MRGCIYLLHLWDAIGGVSYSIVEVIKFLDLLVEILVSCTKETLSDLGGQFLNNLWFPWVKARVVSELFAANSVLGVLCKTPGKHISHTI